MAGIRFEGVTKRFDDGTVAVDDLWLDVPDGEFMILVGPSGCGKTTALRMVAGFEEVTAGQIVLGDRVINDVEPANRDVAMVFQSFALFPHMSVRDNIAFPLRMRGVPKKEVPGQVEEIARLLEIGSLLARMPHELSGGQRQRVAMGRAIVRHPQTFLMDEPLSSLDAKLRTQMRTELARLHQRLGVTTLYVTHDHTEAMTLGSRIAVMRDGVVQQVGPPKELYRRPANVFVARFIGTPPMNLMQGRVVDGGIEIVGGSVSGRIPAGAAAQAADVIVGIRPQAWRLEAGSDPAVVVRGEVEVVEDFGAETIVHFKPEAAVANVSVEEEGDDATNFTARVSGRDLHPGERVELRADAAALHLFDAASGEALAASTQARGAANVS